MVERGVDGRVKVHELELYTCEAEGDFAAVLANIAARSQPPHTPLSLSLSLSHSLSSVGKRECEARDSDSLLKRVMLGSASRAKRESEASHARKRVILAPTPRSNSSRASAVIPVGTSRQLMLPPHLRTRSHSCRRTCIGRTVWLRKGEVRGDMT